MYSIYLHSPPPPKLTYRVSKYILNNSYHIMGIKIAFLDNKNREFFKRADEWFYSNSYEIVEISFSKHSIVQTRT